MQNYHFLLFAFFCTQALVSQAARGLKNDARSKLVAGS
jgi:hypothetical protein